MSASSIGMCGAADSRRPAMSSGMPRAGISGVTAYLSHSKLAGSTPPTPALREDAYMRHMKYGTTATRTPRYALRSSHLPAPSTIQLGRPMDTSSACRPSGLPNFS